MDLLWIFLEASCIQFTNMEERTEAVFMCPSESFMSRLFPPLFNTITKVANCPFHPFLENFLFHPAFMSAYYCIQTTSLLLSSYVY